MRRLSCWFVLSVALMACMPKAPRVHIATATAGELAAANKEREVWYHFKEGDIVPFSTFFFGAGVGATDGAVPVRAQQDFYLVFRRNMPVTISLDGKRRYESGATLLLVSPAPGGEGGQINWITFIGKSADAAKELEVMLKQME